MSKQRFFRPWDVAVYALCIGVVVGFSLFAGGRAGPATVAEITSDEGEFVFSIEEDREIEIRGPIGVSRIVIEEGSARFVDAPCRDQICVHAGWLSDGGAWAACLPNRVFLSVAGQTPRDAIDGLSF